jgi:hypothetical protein
LKRVPDSPVVQDARIKKTTQGILKTQQVIRA